MYLVFFDPITKFFKGVLFAFYDLRENILIENGNIRHQNNCKEILKYFVQY